MTIKLAHSKQTFSILEDKRNEMLTVLDELGDCSNPQVVAVRNRLATQLEVLSSVIDSLKGNHTTLRIL